MNILIDSQARKVLQYRYCCNSMKRAIVTSFIQLGFDPSYQLIILNPPGSSSMPIAHCPFCGEKIHFFSADSPRIFSRNIKS